MVDETAEASREQSDARGSTPARAGAALSTVAFARGVFAFFAVHMLASWAVLVTYDWSRFPASYALRSLLVNAHAGIALAAVCVLVLLGLYRDYRLDKRALEQAQQKAVTRRLRTVQWGAFGGLTVSWLAAAVFLTSSLPLVERRGLPGLVASSDIVIDQLSRRPTVDVRTNEHGFRDRPWKDRAPKEGVARILLVGDSIVFGSGITQQAQTLTPVLERALERESVSAQVFNVSLNGLNFAQEVDLLGAFVGDVKPDLVVVLHNQENDLMPVLPYYAHPNLLAPFPFAFTSYVNAIDRYLSKNRFSSSAALVDEYHADLDRLAALSEKAGFDVLFVYLHYRCPPRYHRLPRKAPRLFMFTLLGDLAGTPGMTFPNDFHPNPRGVEWMAAQLAPKLDAIVAGREQWRTDGSDPLTRKYQTECVEHHAREIEERQRRERERREREEKRRAKPKKPSFVLPPGLEPKILALLQPSELGKEVSGGWRLEGVKVEARVIKLPISRDDQRAELVLSHPSTTKQARWTSESFAMVPSPEAVAEDDAALGALETLAKSIIAQDRGASFWVTPGR